MLQIEAKHIFSLVRMTSFPIKGPIQAGAEFRMSILVNRPRFRPCLCKMPHTDIKTAHIGDLVGFKQVRLADPGSGYRHQRGGGVLQVQVRVHLKLEQVISDNWGGSTDPTWHPLKVF